MGEEKKYTLQTLWLKTVPDCYASRSHCWTVGLSMRKSLRFMHNCKQSQRSSFKSVEPMHTIITQAIPGWNDLTCNTAGWRFEYSSKEGSRGINRLFCCLRYLSAQFSLLSVEISLKRFESRCNMAGCLLEDLNIFIKRGTEAETFCCLSEIWVLNFRCQTLAGENCLKRF